LVPYKFVVELLLFSLLSLQVARQVHNHDANRTCTSACLLSAGTANSVRELDNFDSEVVSQTLLDGNDSDEIAVIVAISNLIIIFSVVIARIPVFPR